MISYQIVEAQQLDTTKTQHLDEVTIKDQVYRPYSSTVTSSATRIASHLLSVPQSIQSVNNIVLKDQQANTMIDAVKNIAGVSPFSMYNDFVIRGFRTNNNGSNMLFNGMRGTFYDFSQPGVMYNVEKVEVIKGPASALFGVGAPGGVINTVTKQPLSEKRYEVSATYGSFQQKRLVLDATGPLTKNKKLLYRFIAGGENSNSFRDYFKVKNVFLAPSLSYKISDKSTVTAEVNYLNDHTNIIYDRGIVATKNSDGTYNLNAVPISWSRHNPDDHTSRHNISAQTNFTHRFSDKISFTTLARYAAYSFQNYQHTSTGLPVGDSLTMIYEDYGVSLAALNINIFASFNLETGFLKHTILAGADYGIAKNPNHYNYFKVPGISIYDTEYESHPADYPQLYSSKSKDKTALLGGYIQDQLSFGENWKALLSLRYDTYDYRSHVNTPATAPVVNNVTENHALLPRVGLVYQIRDHFSAYATYTESFNPNTSYSLNILLAGGPFKPEKGKQLEAGVKKSFFNDQLMTTISVYQLDRTNILLADPTDPLGVRQNSHGKARSKGVEVSMQGNISKSLSVIGNYAFNKSRIVEDNVEANIGNWLPNAPAHSGNTWVKYTTQDGILSGLGIGAGFQFMSERVTQGPQDLKLPGFISYDASVSYHYQKATLSLNMYNLGNTRNFIGGYTQARLWTQAPVSGRLNLTVVF